MRMASFAYKLTIFCISHQDGCYLSTNFVHFINIVAFKDEIRCISGYIRCKFFPAEEVVKNSFAFIPQGLLCSKN